MTTDRNQIEIREQAAEYALSSSDDEADGVEDASPKKTDKLLHPFEENVKADGAIPLDINHVVVAEVSEVLCVEQVTRTDRNQIESREQAAEYVLSIDDEDGVDASPKMDTLLHPLEEENVKANRTVPPLDINHIVAEVSEKQKSGVDDTTQGGGKSPKIGQQRNSESVSDHLAALPPVGGLRLQQNNMMLQPGAYGVTPNLLGGGRQGNVENSPENAPSEAAPPMLSATLVDAITTVEASPATDVPTILRSNRKIRFFVVVLLVMSIALIVGLSVALTRDDNGMMAPSATPVPKPTYAPLDLMDGPFDEIIDEILNEHLTNRSLVAIQSNASSPQAQAYDWLLQDALLQELHVQQLEDVFVARVLQRYALATFYYSTNGDDWVVAEGWLSASHECDWYSIVPELACKTDGENYFAIEIPVNGVTGSIPEDVFLLRHLGTCDIVCGLLVLSCLKMSKLTKKYGPSPFLLSLEHLNFEENALTGTLPTELGLLQYLKFLVVPENRISGPIPSELSQMPLLTELALNNNNLSGTLPEELGSLENLASVFLFGNPRLTGTVPESYGNMPKLGT
jgi:hypothetical protein